ncbi:hypothetical protein [Glutamicibacter nicotianae]|uniref:hypothetical protein n=1 Tax=Glutamicibacter nicotianae TaxID=37929 RepID=UPI0025539DE2|nr:hypothetical protein [Glutamicibacter nicotianae]WIV43051.1 hypothetical protein QQS42_12105 [Glutamicibacter nicotianae]
MALPVFDGVLERLDGGVALFLEFADPVADLACVEVEQLGDSAVRVAEFVECQNGLDLA